MADDEEKATPGQLCSQFCANHWKGVASIVIPIAFLPLVFLSSGVEMRCLYLIAVCCFLWITECIPLYVTSLIPIFALPFLEIMDSDKVCAQYFKDTLVMFVASLMIALAVEYCNLHKRLALRTILTVGCSPRRLHFGLIMVTSFTSMWISNSATTAMMMPIIKAVLEELESNNVLSIYMDDAVEPIVDGRKHPSRPAMAFYIATAYAASIGGVGTLIGTGTNLVFKGIYENRFPNAEDKIDFTRFMAWAGALVWCNSLLLFICFQITHLGLFRPNSAIGQQVKAGALISDTVRAVVLQKYEELGKMTIHETQVAIWFSVMILLLFTRSPGIFPGWNTILNRVVVKSSPPVILCAVALFLSPISCACYKHFSKAGPYPTSRENSALSWEFARKATPWGLVFLLGGGFALSAGSDASGLSRMIGKSLSVLEDLPVSIVLVMVIIFAVFATNFTANIPTCNILMPVICEMAVNIGVNPIFFVFPAGIACSMAFHLPVGTPPNAIAAAYAGIKNKYMAEAGIAPTCFSIINLVLNSFTIHRIIYPTQSLPDWAKGT